MSERIRLLKKRSTRGSPTALREEAYSLLNSNTYTTNPTVNEEGKLRNRIIEKIGPHSSILTVFNHWLERNLKLQLESREIFIGGGTIKLSNVRAVMDPITISREKFYHTPRYCRDNGKTYLNTIRGDATFYPNPKSDKDTSLRALSQTLSSKKVSQTIETKPDILLGGGIPVMVQSKGCILSGLSEGQRLNLGECTSDDGGYFIIEGGERTIITQESLRTGLFMLWTDEETGKVESRITCVVDHGTTVVTMVPGTKLDTLKVGTYYMGRDKHIPLYVAFAFLGYNDTNATNLIGHFLPKNLAFAALMFLQSSIVKGRSVGNNIVAYIIKKRAKQKSSTSNILTEGPEIIAMMRQDLFSHIKSRHGKARALAFMAAQTIMNLMRKRPVDIRDSWSIKKLSAAGKLIEVRLNAIWTNVIKKCQEDASRSGVRTSGLEAFTNAIGNADITSEFIKAFTTSWTTRQGQVTESITDSLKRDTPASYRSQITRISAPTSRRGTKASLREVQQTQLGFVCSAETPEGAGALTEEAMILLQDGTTASIKDLIVSNKVRCVNFSTPGDIHFNDTTVTRQWGFHTDGEKRKLFKLTTNTGHIIEGTDDHPFLTQEGWVAARYLDAGRHKVAMVPCLEAMSRQVETYSVLTAEEVDASYHKEIGFLPLTSIHPLLPVIARLYGYVVSAGTLALTLERTPFMTVPFETQKDATSFVDDMALLGFVKPNILARRRRKRIYYDTTYYEGGAALFLALHSHKDIPEWISKGSPLVKREFLSGLQGGTTVAHPNWLEDAYLHQVAKTFHEFGVNVAADLKAVSGKRGLAFSKQSANRILLADKFTMAYAYSSAVKQWYYAQYLRYVQRQPSHTKPLSFNLFKRQTPVTGNNTVIFFPLERVERIADAMVYDITVESEDHDFIANGFVSHNCGLVKNFAMTCSLSLDRDANDFFKAMKGETPGFENKLPQYYDAEPTPLKWTDYVYLLDSEDPDFKHKPDLQDYKEIKVKTERFQDDTDVDYETNLHLIREEEIIKTFPYPIFINGNPCGWCKGPEVETFLHRYRQFGLVSTDSCIFFNTVTGCLEVDTSGGRPIRPLLIVHEGKLVIDEMKAWNEPIEELLTNGCMMYIDSREQEKLMISQTTQDVREVGETIASLRELIATREATVLRMQQENKGDPRFNLDKDGHLNHLRADLQELLDYPYTHCEIHPIAQYGSLAGMIPESNKIQGPRVTYQAAMGKQALNQYHTHHSERFDTTFKVMTGPSLPIFQSEINGPNGLNEMPAGDTIIKAYYAHPDNPEDGIVVNAAAIRAGKFRLDKYITHKIVIKKGAGNAPDEKNMRPPASLIRTGDGRFHAIDDNGLPAIGAYLQKGDCIVGKVKISKPGSGQKMENASLYVGIGEEGYVDRISINYSSKGDIIIKVKMRQSRNQVEGDKLASRYSQKGTISVILEPEFLPRIRSGPNKGMVADFYVNPHAVPSRMPMAELDEMLTSKAALYTGIRVDATAFNNLDIGKSKAVLRKVWEDHVREHPEDAGLGTRFASGYEDMEVPIRKIPPGGIIGDGPRHLVPTGLYRPCRKPIFMGPCNTQVLRHHVADKFQVRSRGTIDTTTHQPIGGRAKEGGQRLGEMERDALISHGATDIILERLMKVSDVFTAVICANCGNFAVANLKDNIITCGLCKDNIIAARIILPFVFVYLIRLLNMAMISVTFRTVPAASFGTGKEVPLPEDKYVI